MCCCPREGYVGQVTHPFSLCCPRTPRPDPRNFPPLPRPKHTCLCFDLPVPRFRSRIPYHMTWFNIPTRVTQAVGHHARHCQLSTWRQGELPAELRYTISHGQSVSQGIKASTWPALSAQPTQKPETRRKFTVDFYMMALREIISTAFSISGLKPHHLAP